MTAVDELGYLAASLVLATFCAKSMVLLRTLAIASNIAFTAYGYFADLLPIFLLHAVLLPMNCLRLREALGARNQLKLGRRGSVSARATTASQAHPLIRLWARACACPSPVRRMGVVSHE
jgi:hypothetical protein